MRALTLKQGSPNRPKNSVPVREGKSRGGAKLLAIKRHGTESMRVLGACQIVRIPSTKHSAITA